MGAVSDWFASQADILTNIAQTLLPVEKLLTGAAYLIGLSFAFKAVYSLKVYGEASTMSSGNKNIKEPIILLLVAGMFIYFPTGLDVLMTTTFGTSNILAYAPVASGNATINGLFGPGSLVGGPLTLMIQVIGLAAFIRGWVLVARSSSHGQQPGGMGKGLTHVFGGILAMNIVATLQIINNTLYGG